MEWTYLVTAPNQLTAELWAELLREAGLDVLVAPSDTMSFLGVSPRPVRLLVAADQRERALEVFMSIEPAAAEGGR